jgi:nucleoside-diphosphate-sugar epimerase
VFHLAGQTSIYEAKKNPVADLESNVLGLLKLMEYLKTQSQCPIVIITGTATQAGITRKNPINEKTRDNPCTFYDISKLSAEMYLKQYVKEGWIQGCALRLGNVYGKRQDSQNINRGILDKIYLQALSVKTIKVFVKQTCKRDYIYIDDVVSALCTAAINAKKTNGQTFYIGSGKGTSIGGAFRHVISIAALKTGKMVKIKKVKSPVRLSEIENRNVVIDSSKFKRATGWAPKFDFHKKLTKIYV